MKKTLLLALFGASALILGPSIAQALTIDPFTTAFDTGVPGQAITTTPYGGIANQRDAQAFYGSKISSTVNGVANVTLGPVGVEGLPGQGFLAWSHDISYQTRTPLGLVGPKTFQFNVTDWNSPVGNPVDFALILWDGIESTPATNFRPLHEWSITHTVSGSGMLEFNFGNVSDVLGVAELGPVEWAEISYITLSMARNENDVSPGNISFNIGPIEAGSVPDGGMTLALLGGALAGLAALRRKFIA